MKRIVTLLLAAAVLTVAGPARGADKIRVVATIPDLADMTRHVGGDLVEVSSLATGVEDIHAVPMKPSFAVLLNRADAVVLLGLEAEHAFLPALLEAARNPGILRDAPGYIDTSVYVTPLEVPTRIDRSLGDQHPMGNPHINLDPVRGKDMARAIADGLSRKYPQYADTFKKNLDAYLAELDVAIARWETMAAPLKGVKLVSYHPDLLYFADRFGMEAVGTIELRPGVDPTPSHITDLEEQMKREKVQLVVRELQYPAGLAETIAKQTGATLVDLPAMAGGLPDTKRLHQFRRPQRADDAASGQRRGMSEPLLTLEDASIGYEGRAVLEHVSLTIERGEFVALLGPNGAGKTTLLRGVLGLVPVLAGAVRWGFDPRLRPPGYVPQRETLDEIFPLTVAEVVLMGVYARLSPFRPVGRREHARALECLRQVGLAEIKDQPFWALSGGQKQRVLIARALAVEPEIMLLDEPTAGVDPAAEDAIMAVISRLHTEGLTVVLVSHQLRRARANIGTVIWVEDGRAVKGPAEEVLGAEQRADFLPPTRREAR